MTRRPFYRIVARAGSALVLSSMKVKARAALVASIWLVGAMTWAQTSFAQGVPLVFQTTFNCPDWNQTMGGADGNVCSNGDGIAGAGDWKTSNNTSDLITAAANNPSGGGGKGFRHWRGNGDNNNGGGLAITLPANVTEMWVRLYIRFQAGFSWSGGNPLYTKDNYWGSCGSGCVIFGIQGNHSWGVNYNGGVNHPSSLTWAASQGGNTGDGLWHAYEYHLKQNGSSAISTSFCKILS